MACSGLYADGLVAIERDWTVCDVWDANKVLDTIEKVQRRNMGPQ